MKHDPDLRPDNFGIILDFREDLKGFTAWEVWPGAADEDYVQKFLEGISQRVVLVLRRHGISKYTIMGPDDKVTTTLAILQERFDEAKRNGRGSSDSSTPGTEPGTGQTTGVVVHPTQSLPVQEMSDGV